MSKAAARMRPQASQLGGLPLHHHHLARARVAPCCGSCKLFWAHRLPSSTWYDQPVHPSHGTGILHPPPNSFKPKYLTTLHRSAHCPPAPHTHPPPHPQDAPGNALAPLLQELVAATSGRDGVAEVDVGGAAAPAGVAVGASCTRPPAPAPIRFKVDSQYEYANWFRLGLSFQFVSRPSNLLLPLHWWCLLCAQADEHRLLSNATLCSTA